MQGRTVITVAHRLTTVYRADRIFVFDAGQLVENGSHRSLIESGGIYSKYIGSIEPGPQDLIRGQEKPSFEEWVGGNDEKWLLPRSSATQVHSTTPRASSHLFVRLLTFLRGSWRWVALSVLLGVLTVGSNIGLMGTAAYLISMAALRPEFGALQLAIVGVRFFGISRGVFRYSERLTSHNVTFRLLARLRSWFYQALEPLAPARLMQFRSGDLLSRIIADIGSLENFYVRAIAPPLVATAIAAGMVIYFWQFNTPMALIYLFMMLVIGVGVSFLAWGRSRRNGQELIHVRAALHSRLVDGFQGLPELLAFGRGPDFSRLLERDGIALGKIQNQLASLSGLSNAMTVLFVNLGTLAVFYF